MSVHQAHRLPWEILGELYRPGKVDVYVPFECNLDAKQKNKLMHFARCFTDALKEFAATDQRPPEDEEGNSLDPTTWDVYARGGGAYLGYYGSLINGYVQLNLLLMDPEVFQPILQRGREEIPETLYRLCAVYEGVHPEWMVRRFLPVLKGVKMDAPRFKPLTPERLQIIRDHCALMFRCLYSISGENLAFDPEFVVQYITPW